MSFGISFYLPINPAEKFWIVWRDTTPSESVCPIFSQPVLSRLSFQTGWTDGQCHFDRSSSLTMISPQSRARSLQASFTFCPSSHHISQIDNFVCWIHRGNICRIPFPHFSPFMLYQSHKVTASSNIVTVLNCRGRSLLATHRTTTTCYSGVCGRFCYDSLWVCNRSPSISHLDVWF